MRTRTSFQKRQKEIARMEKQRDKAAKRLQRKLGEKSPEEDPDAIVAEESDGTAAEVALEAPLAAPPVSEGH